MRLDFAGGRGLLLAGSGRGWLWVAAGLAALALLLLLYREERRLVSRGAGLGLLGLRLLAAAGVLVLALFEPIASRAWRESVRGRVLVAVDDSESMTTVDPGRPPPSGKALATSPGDRVEGLSRRDIARRLVDGPDSPLARLSTDHDVRSTLFARDASPEVPLADLAEALRKAPRTDDPARSDHRLGPRPGPGLEAARRRPGRRRGPPDRRPPERPGRPLAAGRPPGRPGHPDLSRARRLDHPPPDSAVASIKAPEGVNKGDVAIVSASIKLDGLEPEPASR